MLNMQAKNYFLSILGLLLCLNHYSAYALEGDTYAFSWLDTDKEVYVLQNRKYKKVSKIFASAGYGMTTSGSFVDATNIQGRIGFFAFENWGVELLYSSNSGIENAAAASVRNQLGGKGSKPFRRIVDNYMAGMIVWSPFYAKVNTFNFINYIDWTVGVGYGQLNETNNIQEFSNQFAAVPLKESHNGFIFETSMQFFITQMFNIRFDIAAFRYLANEGVVGSNAIIPYYNYDMTLSIGMML